MANLYAGFTGYSDTEDGTCGREVVTICIDHPILAFFFFFFHFLLDDYGLSMGVGLGHPNHPG